MINFFAEALPLFSALEGKQIERVQALKTSRDSAAVEAALARLKEDAARDGRNLMPPIVDAARAYVTMRAMCDALREVWGTWCETPVF
jgi:methylmalonyl-CoA mutase N-terminal domain/subunit